MKVLIVDDDPASRFYLEESLGEWSYEVISVSNGEAALEAIESDSPDLILLDILMPGLSGYEVCRRLQSDPSKREIPVLFITVKDNEQDIAKGFELGAVDYITKPFKILEVKARVETHLALKEAKQSLKNQNTILEEKVCERTKELLKAGERLEVLDKAKTDFLVLISHELRTPLSGILGVPEILMKGGLDDEDQVNLVEETFKRSRERLLAILDEALLLTKIKLTEHNFILAPTSVNQAMMSAINLSTSFADGREVSIGTPPDIKEMVNGDLGLLSKALSSLIKTAIKFSNKNKSISFSYKPLPTKICVKIRAEGLTIPEDRIPQFFEVFSISEAITPGGDLGLAPPVAEALIKLFDGAVSVANHDGPGVLFTVSLKKSIADQEELTTECVAN